MKLKKIGSLFDGSSSGLERRVVVRNNADNFGITEENLTSFLVEDKKRVAPRDHDFSASQHLFDGFKDLERSRGGLPVEVYQSLNTSEIAALFVGDAVAKKYPDLPFVGRRTYNALKEERDVAQMASFLVSIGYNYSPVLAMRNVGFKSHPTKSGDLIRRIDALPKYARDILRESLFRERAIPSRENPKNCDYYDFNLLGAKFGYNRPDSASFYVKSVVSGMRSVYRR